MAKKYTLIAKEHFSGSVPIKKGDDIMNLTGDQVVRFLKNDSAEFKTKKEKDTFIGEFEAEKREIAENEAKAKALLEKETLQNELISICTDAVKKAAEVDGVVLKDTEVLENVEILIANFRSNLNDVVKEKDTLIAELTTQNEEFIKELLVYAQEKEVKGK